MLKKHLGFGLNTLALALFIPGIMLPMFSLNMELAATLNVSTFSSPLIEKELSIMQTVADLWRDERLLVAALIFLFSVCIPITKSLCVTFAYFKRYNPIERKIMSFVAQVGKWSMADVFVVAIFLAILSTNHADTANNHQLSVFGFAINFDISTETLSAAGEGFYYFTAYCVLSLFGTHLAWSSLNDQK